MYIDSVQDIRGKLTGLLAGVRVALCVTGSVSAYRAVDVARLLIRHGADVIPVMTEPAIRIIGPDLMQWATGHRPVTELTGGLEHVMIGGEAPGSASVILVAPATATTISRIAHGDASDPVSAVVNVALGAGKPVVVAPAMHEQMHRNPAVVDSLNRLTSMGVTLVPPVIEEGKAKLAPPEEIAEAVISAMRRKSLKGLRILVTAGATAERLDPIRLLTNRGSGKTGVAVALEAAARGAEVALIHGSMSIPVPRGIRSVEVETTEEMLERALELAQGWRPHAAVATAAAADFRPERSADGKIPTDGGPMELKLVPTPKVIDGIAAAGIPVMAYRAVYGVRGDDELAMEGREYIRRHRGVFAVAVNDVSVTGMGFGSDHNRLILVSGQRIVKLPPLHKRQLAVHVLDFMEEELGIRGGGP